MTWRAKRGSTGESAAPARVLQPRSVRRPTGARRRRSVWLTVAIGRRLAGWLARGRATLLAARASSALCWRRPFPLAAAVAVPNQATRHKWWRSAERSGR